MELEYFWCQNPEPKAKVTAISFGSSPGYLSYSNRVLGRFSYFHADIFEVNTKTYCMDDLPDWIHALPDATRGYKYWIWKPYIILDALLRAKENEIIFYTDGRSDVAGALPWLQAFAAGKDDMLACQMTHVEQKWTNGDILNEFGVDFDTDGATCGQFMATFVVLRRTVASVRLVSCWLQFMQDHYAMCSMAPSKLPNHSSFSENRNDQSVLSLLLKTNSILDLTLTVLNGIEPYIPHTVPHCK